MTNPVSIILREKGVRHRVFRHQGEINSIEQAATERGQKPGQVVRSILFRLSEGEYALVLIAGSGQIPWRNLRRYLGTSRLTLATDDEVLSSTGYVPGSVSPVGLVTDVRVLVDESISKVDEISIGSGMRGEAVILASQDLLEVIGRYETGKFGAD